MVTRSENTDTTFIPNNAINEHNAMNHPISQPFKESVSSASVSIMSTKKSPRGRR